MPGDAAPVNDFTSSLANFGAGRKNSFRLSRRLARECRGRNTSALAWSGILGCLTVRRYFRLAKKPWKASFRGTARLGTESPGRSFTPSWGDGFKSGWGISFNIMVSPHGAVLRFEFGAVYPIFYCPVPSVRRGGDASESPAPDRCCWRKAIPLLVSRISGHVGKLTATQGCRDLNFALRRSNFKQAISPFTSRTSPAAGALTLRVMPRHHLSSAQNLIFKISNSN